MKKSRFTKLGSLFLGLSMALGVGAAISAKKVSETRAADKITTVAGITSGSKYYIGATKSNGTDYYLSVADHGTSTATGKKGSAVTSKSDADVFTFISNTSGWAIQFASGNYLSLATSKSNGNVNVVFPAENWTITNSDSLLNFKINNYCLMCNSSTTTTNFGSYASGQLNLWLLSADSGSTTTYTLTLNSNNGSGETSDLTSTTSSTFTLPDCEFDAPSGKKFKGWSTSQTGEVITGTTYTISSGTAATLYAIWEDSSSTDDTETLIISSSTLGISGSTSSSGNISSESTYSIYTFSPSSSNNMYNMSTSDAVNAFKKDKTDGAIFLGKNGAYIYNNVAFDYDISKIELYSNKGASAKVSVSVDVGKNVLSSAISSGHQYGETLATVDSVYTAIENLGSGYKFFRFQVTNANNAQVQFRITFSKQANPSVALDTSSIECQTNSGAQTLTATPSNFSGTVSYSWSVKAGSATDIVSFTNSNSANLSFTPVKAGSTIIVCTVTDGVNTETAECNVIVTTSVESIKFVDKDSQEITSVTTYDSYTDRTLPSVVVTPSTANQEFTWSITSGTAITKKSDTSYNVVEAGQAVITAVSVADPSVTCTLTITVEADVVDAIRLKDGSVVAEQFAGQPFDSTGLKFEKHWQKADKWNVCTDDEIAFSDAVLTSTDTTAVVTFVGTDVTLTLDITVGAEEILVYQLVTDVSALSIGDKIVLVGDDSNDALSTNQASSNRTGTTVEKNQTGTQVTINNNVQKLTISEGNKSNTFALYTGAGYLYASSSSSNQLKTQTDLSDNSSWSISITDGVASLVAQGTNTRNVMQYNPNNGSPIFACYGSASQKAIQIFKEKTNEPVAVTGVSLNQNEKTIFVNGTFQLTATVAPADATETGVTWSSDTTSIATVDDNGLVTGVSAGTAEITVTTIDGEFTDTCAITVEERTTPAGEYYGLVESTDELEDGNYLIAYNHEGVYKVFDGTDAGSDYVEGEVDADGNIAFKEGMAVITISTIDGGYSLLVNGGDNDGKYMYGTSGSNKLNFGTTESVNTISITSGEATITSNTSVLRFNTEAGSGSDRFRYYKSESTTYPVVSLYKLIEDTPDTPTLTAGRYYIMSADGNYGLSGQTYVNGNSPDAINLTTGNELKAFDVAIENGEYGFSVHPQGGGTCSLVYNATYVSGNPEYIRVTDGHVGEHGTWILEPVSGGFIMKINSVGTTMRYLGLYENQKWYGYTDRTQATVVKFVEEGSLAKEFANSLLTKVSCDATGVTAPSTTTWSEVADEFAALTIAYERGLLTNGTANASSESEIEKALAKYDYIVAKYGSSTYADFLDRAPTSPARYGLSLGLDELKDSTWIVAVVAIAGLTAIGGCFFYRKRKQY